MGKLKEKVVDRWQCVFKSYGLELEATCCTNSLNSQVEWCNKINWKTNKEARKKED